MSGILPAPRAQQTAGQAGRCPGCGVPRTALHVPRPAASVSTAQKLARGGFGSARLRHFAHRIDTMVGEAHGERVRHWFATKKAGWDAVLADPKMPAMRTVLDQ